MGLLSKKGGEPMKKLTSLIREVRLLTNAITRLLKELKKESL